MGRARQQRRQRQHGGGSATVAAASLAVAAAWRADAIVGREAAAADVDSVAVAGVLQRSEYYLRQKEEILVSTSFLL